MQLIQNSEPWGMSTPVGELANYFREKVKALISLKFDQGDQVKAGKTRGRQGFSND